MTDPRNFYFNSAYDVDKIIGVFTNTFAIAPSGSTPLIDVKAHGFGDSTYFQGIFTTDNGITWNDFGAQTPNLSNPSAPVFQTVDVEAMVDTTNVNVYMTNSTAATITLTYKIYLLAKNIMAKPIVPLNINQLLFFDSNFNYQKIALEGNVTFSVTSGSTGTTIVPHNLGYIPSIRAFFFPGINQCFSFSQITIPPTSSPILQAQIDSTNLTFFSDQSGFSGTNFSGTIEYRIYYDD